MELRLFVVEPESIRRRLICESISESHCFTVCGSSSSLMTEDVMGLGEADVFLVNADLLDTERNALLATSHSYPDAFFVLCGSQLRLDVLLTGVQLPVRGFLSYNHLSADEFERSLKVIAYGGAVIEPICAQMLLEHLRSLMPVPEFESIRPPNDLTGREHEVLALVRKGLSNKEIALRMHISMGTVRAHLRNIFRKLDVTSRAGAAVSSLASSFSRNRLAG